MIVDTHNDLLTELAFRRDETTPFAAYWQEQMREGGVALQVCPIYPAPNVAPEGTLRNALQQASAFHRAVREGRGSIVRVRRRSDLEGLDPTHRLGLMLSMEGVEPLGTDPRMFDDILGARCASWSRSPGTRGTRSPTVRVNQTMGVSLVWAGSW